MKWISGFVLALGLVAVCQPSAKAQCTTSYTVNYCYGNQCTGQYASPGACNMAHGAGCSTIPNECCGHIVNVWNGESGCGNALLQSPSTRRTLDMLSDRGIEIAIVGCDHHLALYRHPADPSNAPAGDLIKNRASLIPAGF